MSRDKVLGKITETIKEDFYHEKDSYPDAFCGICEVAVDIAFRNTKCILIGDEKTGPRRDKGTFGVEAGYEMKSYSDFGKPEYDDVHRKMCEICISELRKEDLPSDYGVAQMIVNMATRYMYAHWFCEDDAHRLEMKDNYHFILDSYTLRWLNCCGLEGKPKCLNRNTIWGRLNYDRYIEIQRYADMCVKTIFPDYSRIEAEILIEEEVKLYDAMKTINVFEKIDPENYLLSYARNYFGEADKVKLHGFMEAINNG